MTECIEQDIWDTHTHMRVYIYINIYIGIGIYTHIERCGDKIVIDTKYLFSEKG